MKTYVKAGETYALRGVLAAGDTLVGAAGTYGTPSGAALRVGGTAINDGTIALAGGPAVSGAFADSGASLRNIGTLTNNGVIALQGGAFGTNDGGAVTGARLVNDGTLLNTGSIEVGGAPDGGAGTQPGTGALLRDLGVLTNTGVLFVAGEPGNAAGSTGPAGGTVAVSGTLQNSGTIDLQGSPHGGLRGAYLGAGGVLKVLATGTLDNSGMLRIDGNGPDTFEGAGGTLIDRGVLLNTGTIQLGATGRFTSSEGGALLTIASGGTLTNAGLLDANDGYHRLGAGGVIDAGVLSNSGTLLVHGSYYGTTLAVSGSLSNTGLISLFGGPAPDYDGSGIGFGATLLNTGVLVNAGTLVVQAGDPTTSRTGPGVNALLQDQGMLTNTGLLTIEGGGYSFYYFGGSFGGQLDVSGVLINNGTLTAGAGTDQPPGGTESRGSIAVSGTLTNAGLLTLQGGRYVEGGQLIDSGTVLNTGTLSIGGSIYGTPASFTITATGTLINDGTIMGGGTIVNQGAITAASPTATIVGVSVVNDGTVSVGAGTALSLSGSVIAFPASEGIFDLSAHSTLTLGGAIGRGEHIDFIGGSATLALGDARDFAGTLQNLNAQETIDFLKLDVIGVTASPSALLVDIAGGSTLDLALAAPLPDQAMLHLAADGHGGTDLRIGPASSFSAALSSGSGQPLHVVM